MRIAICEDNAAFQEYIAELINKYEKNHHNFQIDTFSSGEALVSAYEQSQRYDLVFLDMQLGEMDGIETGKAIRGFDKKCVLIIITSIIEYAIEGYGIGATDFILKPIDEEKFGRVLDEAVRSITKTEADYYFIQTRHKTLAIDIVDIVHFESNGRNTVVYTVEESYENHESISAIEEKLNDCGFFRISRYYLVNLRHIREIGKREVVMYNRKVLKFSKNLGNEIKNKFMECMMEEM